MSGIDREETTMKLLNVKLTKEEKKAAFELGVSAFKNNIMRVPAYDINNILALCVDKPFGFSALIMTEWTKGWDSENLK